MLLYRAFLRALGVTALLGLGLGLACKGSKGGSSTPAATATISGTITYTRVPLAKDANGVPTGLVDSTVASNLKSLPARGTAIRAYQRDDETMPDGTTSTVWLLVGQSFTGSNGTYSLTVPNTKPVMVELLSSFDGGNGYTVDVIGDPAGINSAIPVSDRWRYAMRKAADGTSPVGNPTPASVPTGNSTVDFSIGLQDKWWLVNPSYRPGPQVVPMAANAVDETTLPGRATGTGSRILAIGDSVATFLAAYGTATPGQTLDLHYAPGISDPRGSFIEFDPSVYPLSVVANVSTGTLVHQYFGSLQAGINDDAWDEGVIFPLLARSFLYPRIAARTFGMPQSPLFPQAVALTDLSPDAALLEGLTRGMAANLLQSPYLADTQGTGLAAPLTDIRDLSGLSASQVSPYSAPAIGALTWELILKANGLPSPGTTTDWAKITTSTLMRFFTGPVYAGTSTNYETEPLNIYKQLGRLQESKGTLETVDLATIFTDAALTQMTAPFGIPWPRPTTGPLAAFAFGWGADPNSLTTPIPALTLSMANAVQVRGTYPNQSEGEVAYAGFTLSADRAYTLTVTANPPLATTAQLEMVIPYFQGTPIVFSGGGGSQRIVLTGNSTTPVFQPLRVRMVSPTTLQPDTTVTISLVPVP